jgi:NAD+ kinase
MKKIGILYHPLKESAQPFAGDIEKYLDAKGVSVWKCSAWDAEQAKEKVNGTELILTVGGDGTILRAVQAIVPGPVPITGINLGNLGFMTELGTDEAEKGLDDILAGKGWIDERCLLEAEVQNGNGPKSDTYYALNDVVLARGEIARVIHVRAVIDGQDLTTYKADGVIVASATGSTGYALAAHGPVMYPQSGDMLLVPVTPHLSSSHPLVLADTSVVNLSLSTFNPATLSIDGHINTPLQNGAVVTVKRSRHTVRFLRIHPQNTFYSLLERKLKGKR